MKVLFYIWENQGPEKSDLPHVTWEIDGDEFWTQFSLLFKASNNHLYAYRHPPTDSANKRQTSKPYETLAWLATSICYEAQKGVASVNSPPNELKVEPTGKASEWAKVN